MPSYDALAMGVRVLSRLQAVVEGDHVVVNRELKIVIAGKACTELARID